MENLAKDLAEVAANMRRRRRPIPLLPPGRVTGTSGRCGASGTGTSTVGELFLLAQPNLADDAVECVVDEVSESSRRLVERTIPLARQRLAFVCRYLQRRITAVTIWFRRSA